MHTAVVSTRGGLQYHIVMILEEDGSNNENLCRWVG